MNSTPILPYYHPTTVVIVDDNDLFLHTLDLRMPAEMAYVLHHDARAALQRVNQPLSLRPIPERCFIGNAAESRWHDSFIKLDLSLIEQEIKNTERFLRTSVVVVDYAMPEMNGLEFCKSIEDTAVKKVLLTGVADEKLAVKAFNEGTIDRFLPKNGNSTLDLVVSFAQDLQRAYFVEQQRAFGESLSLSPPNFASDPAISAFFSAARERCGFVEHYLVGDPPGFLMVSSGGDLFRLVVLGERESAAQADFARRHNAPRDVVSDLDNRRCVGYFFDDFDALGEDPFNWADYLHEAHIIRGNQTWCTALIADPPIDIDFDPGESSFRAYLDRVDRGASA